MATKKKDETGEILDPNAETQAAGDETPAGEENTTETKRGRKAKSADAGEGSTVDTVIDAATSAAETVANALSEGASKLAEAVSGSTEGKTASKGKRAERIGIVASDKMTKTVVVRVDRVVKHPVYRKYVRRRKKFMAHDELGSKIGDKVRIIETRPLSARKRWRVVEIIQKAEL